MAKADITGRLNLDSTGFERGIQRSKQAVGKMQKAVVGAANALAKMGLASASAAVLLLSRNAMNLAFETKNLSKLAGESSESFQKVSYAAKQYGVESEKVADILKDTNDKIGDFIQTGAGPMADFFEKIAPKVGATKEEFIGLSGSDALQRYYNYLKKANLSQQEMTFYMEAIASDATLLIPL